MEFPFLAYCCFKTTHKSKKYQRQPSLPPSKTDSCVYTYTETKTEHTRARCSFLGATTTREVRRPGQAPPHSLPRPPGVLAPPRGLFRSSHPGLLPPYRPLSWRFGPVGSVPVDSSSRRNREIKCNLMTFLIQFC